MANAAPAVSFDDIIQEGRRKKAAERLAQEIFGRKGRSSAPPTAPKSNLGGSLASRVGITKQQRNPSIPRPTTPRQNPRASQFPRPAPNDNHRPRPARTRTSPIVLSDDGPLEQVEIANGGPGVNFKGAASGPYVVIAQNFANGTTAEDIESVMLSVGGEMTGCRLVASNPTVIAEMSFIEKSGADKVIDTFNGKKADGRPLYVYRKYNGGAIAPGPSTRQSARVAEPVQPKPIMVDDDVDMEVDENAESREAEDRLREERRGRERDHRAPPRDVLPTGPRGYQSEMDRYGDRRSRRPEPNYSDGRYGFGGNGYRGGPRGGYDDRGYGGQGYRR